MLPVRKWWLMTEFIRVWVFSDRENWSRDTIGSVKTAITFALPTSKNPWKSVRFVE
jgi:hypothetical protein